MVGLSGADRIRLDGATNRLKTSVNFLKMAAELKTLGIELNGTHYFLGVAKQTLETIRSHIQALPLLTNPQLQNLEYKIDQLSEISPHTTLSDIQKIGVSTQQLANGIQSGVDRQLGATSECRLIPYSRFEESLRNTVSWQKTYDDASINKYGYDDRRVMGQVYRAPYALIEEMQPDPELSKILKGVIKGLNGSVGTSRSSVINSIRKDDSVYSPNQGLIYKPIIIENRESILRLAQVAEECDVVIGKERGGGFLTDLIEGTCAFRGAHHLPECIKVPKSEERGLMGAQLNSLIETAIEKYGPDCRIGLSETVVGGSSIRTLLKDILPLARKYEGVTFKILAHRQMINRDPDIVAYGKGNVVVDGGTIILHDSNGNQTIADDGEIKASKIINKSRNIELHIAPTRYILGEDVGYQLSPFAQHPLVVIGNGGVEQSIQGVKITPNETSSSRAELIRLILGNYDAALPN